MTNRYDVLFRPPADPLKALPDGAMEALAQRLVHSGLLRLSADDGRNFILHSTSGGEHSFSYRELHDAALLPHSMARIRGFVSASAGKQEMQDYLEMLRRQFKTIGRLHKEREYHIARLLVQAAHPVVFHWCLRDHVPIFVSYEHRVADLLAVHFWEGIGQSNGLQSISQDGAAVYISCGGDPFLPEDAPKTYTTDGFAALARLMVIAAQELGHFADIKRDFTGQMVGRHSARLSPVFAPQMTVANARESDIKTTKRWQQWAVNLGLTAILRHEQHWRFYHGKGVRPLWRLYHRLMAHYYFRRLLNRAKARTLYLFSEFTSQRPPDRLWGHHLQSCLSDMAFNLAPNAEAYRRDNPLEQEAILCVEALARVPQQRLKWGEAVCTSCWPELCRIYDEEVITSAEISLKAASK